MTSVHARALALKSAGGQQAVLFQQSLDRHRSLKTSCQHARHQTPQSPTVSLDVYKCSPAQFRTFTRNFAASKHVRGSFLSVIHSHTDHCCQGAQVLASAHRRLAARAHSLLDVHQVRQRARHAAPARSADRLHHSRLAGRPRRTQHKPHGVWPHGAASADSAGPVAPGTRALARLRRDQVGFHARPGAAATCRPAGARALRVMRPRAAWRSPAPRAPWPACRAPRARP